MDTRGRTDACPDRGRPQVDFPLGDHRPTADTPNRTTEDGLPEPRNRSVGGVESDRPVSDSPLGSSHTPEPCTPEPDGGTRKSRGGNLTFQTPEDLRRLWTDMEFRKVWSGNLDCSSGIPEPLNPLYRLPHPRYSGCPHTFPTFFSVGIPSVTEGHEGPKIAPRTSERRVGDGPERVGRGRRRPERGPRLSTPELRVGVVSDTRESLQ